jgi:hypothetical protein
LSEFNTRLAVLYDIDSERIDDRDLAGNHAIFPDRNAGGLSYPSLVQHVISLWLDNIPEPQAPYLQERQDAILEAAWATMLSSCGVVVRETPEEEAVKSTRGESEPTDDSRSESRGPSASSRAQSVVSSSHPASSQEDGRSEYGGSQDSGRSRRSRKLEKTQRSHQAVKRLRSLALSVMAPEQASKVSQHSVLARWPEARGTPTEGYISTVREAQEKKSEAARRRGGRMEARKERLAERYRVLRPDGTRESSQFSQGADSSQSRPVSAYSQSQPASVPVEPLVSPQPRPTIVQAASQETVPSRRQPPWPGSSQPPWPGSSQTPRSSQPTSSQLRLGKKKKKKPKSGFR